VVPATSIQLSDAYTTHDLPFSFGTQESYKKYDASLALYSANNEWSVRAYFQNAGDEIILLRTVRFGGNVAAA
ncbi:hypothetical protein, partial [Pseudoalteromonas undina]